MTAAVELSATAATRGPIGLRAFRLIVAICYFIYIAVAFFRSENFLFGLDALLAVAVLFAISSRAFAAYTASHGYILLLVSVYSLGIVYAWVGLSAPAELASLKTLRNLLYCGAVFVVALTYVTTRERLADLLKLMTMLTVLSAFYGFRQAIFGFWGFELERLALMGASLKELLTLGRSRLTATFGDPLLCGFFMMTGIFLLRARWHIGQLTRGARWFYAVGALSTFVVLVASLTRAPLLGFAVGTAAILIIDFRLTPRSLKRIARATMAGLAFLGAVVWIFESGMLANSPNAVMRFLDTGLSSVWSLIALFMGGVTEDTYFLVGQSRDMRVNAWTQGVEFLKEHPFGAGFSSPGQFTFSLGDSGFLQVGLLAGIPGILAYLLLLVVVFLKGWAQFHRTRDPADRRVLSALLGLWIGFIVTTAISSLATSSVASVIMWLVAAVLVNASVIFGGARRTPASQSARAIA